MQPAAIVVVIVAIACAGAAGRFSDATDSDPDHHLDLARGATPIKTTRLLMIDRRPSTDRHRPRLRMILIIRRRLSLAHPSSPPADHIPQTSASTQSDMNTIASADQPVSSPYDDDDIKPVAADPEWRYVRKQSADQSDMDRVASSFTKTSLAADARPRLLRRGTVMAALIVIATLCGLTLLILLIRPRKRQDGDLRDEVDDKTYAPLLTTEAVTTT